MTEIDAYRFPQKVRPGCQHQLGCKCIPPYWLRASSPAEEAREAQMRPLELVDYERLKEFAP